MNIKKGCILENVKPEIMYACGVIDALFRTRYQTCTFTSFRDGTHGENSKHFKGEAVDVRTRNLTQGEGDSLYAEIKHFLDPKGFDVVDERHPKARQHFHIEFDPKPKEKFLTEVP